MARIDARQFLEAIKPNPGTHRGSVALDALAKLAGYQGDYLSETSRAAMNALQARQTAGEFYANEGGTNYAPDVGSITFNPDFIKALDGFSFIPTSDTERLGYNIVTPDGQSRLINWATADSSFDKFADKAIPIGIGALAAGSALGWFGGGGGAGAGTAGGFTSGAVDAAALGLDGAAAGGAGGAIGGGAAGGLGASGAITGGAGLTAGGISGAGITAPALGGTAGLGAGLGTVGAAGGAGGAAAGGGMLASLGGVKGLLPVGASLLGTGLQLNAASKARDDMQAATTAANNLQRYMYDTTRADNMPALQARNSALQQMQALLANPGSITSTPGYQFGFDQGNKSLNNGAAARGMSQSGAADKARIRYGQDYAGSKLTESANRLMALASGGQAGSSQIGAAGSSYAGNVGNALMQQGDANAAFRIGQSNAIGNAINGLTAYGVRKNWWGD